MSAWGIKPSQAANLWVLWIFYMRKQALGKKSCRKDSNLKQEFVRQE
jgi:hypothetical protein